MSYQLCLLALSCWGQPSWKEGEVVGPIVERIYYIMLHSGSSTALSFTYYCTCTRTFDVWEIFKHAFNIHGIWPQTNKYDTNTLSQCSPASVGLAQARPNEFMKHSIFQGLPCFFIPWIVFTIIHGKQKSSWSEAHSPRVLQLVVEGAFVRNLVVVALQVEVEEQSMEPIAARITV